GLGDAAQDAARTRQHLGDPHDGELAQWHQAMEPLLRHALAADSGKAQALSAALAKRRHQATAQGIARRFARNDIDERRAAALLVRRCAHGRATPTTKRPDRSAAATTAARSMMRLAPASTAMPRKP